MKDRERKIQEMTILEQNLQDLLLQKQAFQMEISETKSAMKEIEKSREDVFKIIGQLMIKTENKKVREELANKEKIMDMRIKSIEKQEGSISEKLDELRKEVLK